MEQLISWIAPGRPELAGLLLAELGSIGRVLREGPRRLRRLGAPQPAALLECVAALMESSLRADLLDRPLCSSLQSLLDYLAVAIGYRATECVRVLYLDAKKRLILDEMASEGSISEAPLFVREIMRRALDLGAAGLLIVHNHPSGDPYPSQQDKAITRQLVEAGRFLEVSVHDHLIVAGSRHFSMRAEGLLA